MFLGRTEIACQKERISVSPYGFCCPFQIIIIIIMVLL